METNDTYQPLVKQIKQYFETRYKLLKYQAIAQRTTIISAIITDVAMATVFMVAFVFITLTLAFLAGNFLGSNWAGFGCVTLLYLFLSLLSRLFKITIENVLIRVLIQRIFKHKNNLTSDK
ncbi:hypothetical protein [Mucilaginibacter ginsenosidivorax]|uniref:Phage holin family protein n=1 Tax=Mucilaginibacter ginsenosidivorax TaxID=862126 RepID=A0A5B8WA69_9SPHI|nr:hypothetical protein [Mucilaginibacter ginsenosidivorax]QEC79866.1 hypothetical protein FSB76_29360 [Mucilaginibacter ginsenosidivorax]